MAHTKSAPLEGPAADTPHTESLDPEDWEAFRAQAHELVDDLVARMANVRERPVWRSVPEQSRDRIRGPLPVNEGNLNDALTTLREHILPYPTGNDHPRFWGWVMGNGTADAMLAEMATAVMNPNAGGGDTAATVVEQQVVAWLAEVMGFPSDASGVLVNGASMANFVALAVARHARAGFDVLAEGMQSAGHPPLTVYGSVETHSCVPRALQLLGFGLTHYRTIPVDASYRVDIDALRLQMERDVAAGMRPACVVGTVGTVNTGASDDIPALAELAHRHGAWLHVDGAFGALARLGPALADRVIGIDQADSLAFDLHKWGYLPYGVACVLVRDGTQHHDAFAYTVSYIATTTRGFLAPGTPFADRGVELSRRFNALKVWLSLRTHGTEKLGRIIARNVADCRHLVRLIESHPELELLAPAPLNIVNFRYRGPGRDSTDDVLNDVNQEILLRLQESGVAMPSSTVLNGRFSIRVANTNHRTVSSDFDVLVDAVVGHGRTLMG
jgi:glutamate/tyrosine decarboxylase-like PLP-dependent enzyme